MSIGTVAMVLQVFPALNSKIVVLTASSKTPLVLTPSHPPQRRGGWGSATYPNVVVCLPWGTLILVAG